jgi:hypothetical protein
MLIVPGVTYWQEAKYWYNDFAEWQRLKSVNGWHERGLPIGERMVIPQPCNDT